MIAGVSSFKRATHPWTIENPYNTCWTNAHPTRLHVCPELAGTRHRGALTFVINDLIALYGKPSNNQFQFLGSGN